MCTRLAFLPPPRGCAEISRVAPGHRRTPEEAEKYGKAAKRHCHSAACKAKNTTGAELRNRGRYPRTQMSTEPYPVLDAGIFLSRSFLFGACCVTNRQRKGIAHWRSSTRPSLRQRRPRKRRPNSCRTRRPVPKLLRRARLSCWPCSTSSAMTALPFHAFCGLTTTPSPPALHHFNRFKLALCAATPRTDWLLPRQGMECPLSGRGGMRQQRRSLRASLPLISARRRPPRLHGTMLCTRPKSP